MDAKITEDPLSIEYDLPQAKIIFGKSLLKKEVLFEHSTSVEYCFLDQVHSDVCVEATCRNQATADSHWTQQKMRAPVIRTADCLPLFIVNPDCILGIHGGWRGLEKEIIQKSLQTSQFKIQPSSAVFIGPHIQSNSFEVSLEVGERLTHALLKASSKIPPGFRTAHINPSKVWMDLSLLANAQLQSCGFEPHQIISSRKDTFTDLEFNSFRRDSGELRNWSFGFLKSEKVF